MLRCYVLDIVSRMKCHTQAMFYPLILFPVSECKYTLWLSFESIYSFQRLGQLSFFFSFATWFSIFNCKQERNSSDKVEAEQKEENKGKSKVIFSLCLKRQTFSLKITSIWELSKRRKKTEEKRHGGIPRKFLLFLFSSAPYVKSLLPTLHFPCVCFAFS